MDAARRSSCTLISWRSRWKTNSTQDPTGPMTWFLMTSRVSPTTDTPPTSSKRSPTRTLPDKSTGPPFFTSLTVQQTFDHLAWSRDMPTPALARPRESRAGSERSADPPSGALSLLPKPPLKLSRFWTPVERGKGGERPRGGECLGPSLSLSPSLSLHLSLSLSRLFSQPPSAPCLDCIPGMEGGANPY